MKTKKMLALLLAGLMVMSLAACGGGGGNTSTTAAGTEGTEAAGGSGAASGEKVGETVFMYAFNQSIENPEAQAVLKMSDKLYDATDGRYSIEIYPNETAGTQAESLGYIQNGSVHMGMVSNSIIEGNVSDFAITGAPYVYTSDDHQQALFESGDLDEFFSKTQENGYTILAVYSLGARNVYATFPVTSMDDLSGKKIRTMESDTMVKMMEALGGVSVPMSQGDVVSAIQNKTIDGAENNIITYVDLNQYEAADQYSLTNHLMIPDMMIINNDVLAGMSEEDQEALKTAAKESITDFYDLANAQRQDYFDKAQEELGVTVNDVDIAPFQEACQDLIAEIAGRNDDMQAAYDTIQKYAE